MRGICQTTNLIGNLLSLLADRPKLWRQPRKDRALVDPVIRSAAADTTERATT
jgi:hypothetical protein